MSAPAEPSVAQRFKKLAKQWNKETGHLSVIEQMTDHPAYREIVALGWPVVPCILADLQRQPNHWFVALTAITGEDPIPEEDAGNVAAMAAAWVAWGHRKGIFAQGVLQ